MITGKGVVNGVNGAGVKEIPSFKTYWKMCKIKDIWEKGLGSTPY